MPFYFQGPGPMGDSCRPMERTVGQSKKGYKKTALAVPMRFSNCFDLPFNRNEMRFWPVAPQFWPSLSWTVSNHPRVSNVLKAVHR